MSLRQRHGNAMAKTGRAASWVGKVPRCRTRHGYECHNIDRLVPLAFLKDSEKGESSSKMSTRAGGLCDDQKLLKKTIPERVSVNRTLSPERVKGARDSRRAGAITASPDLAAHCLTAYNPPPHMALACPGLGVRARLRALCDFARAPGPRVAVAQGCRHGKPKHD